MIVSENLAFIYPSVDHVFVEGLSPRPRGPFDGECQSVKFVVNIVFL